MPRPSRIRPATAVGFLLLFVVLAVAFFWRLWAPSAADRLMIGAPGGDFLRQFYPWRAFVARAWAGGHLPLWNPHQSAGTPALADPQLAVLYPARLPQALMALVGRRLPLVAVELEAVLHVALGGWLTALLVRRLGAALPAAALGGVAFGFGGFLVGYPVEQLAVLDTAVWIPAVLLALTAALQADRAGDRAAARRWTLGAGGFGALAVLAGHPQTAQYLVVAAGAWLGWSVLRPSDVAAAGGALSSSQPTGVRPSASHADIEHRDTQRHGRLRTAPFSARAGQAAGGHQTTGHTVRRLDRLRTTAVRGGGALLVAAGLSAAQWLPTIGFWRRSARAPDLDALAAGLPPGDLVQLVAPSVVSHWSPLFVGLVALVMALWGLGAVRRASFWLALAAGGWLLALGGHGPLFGLWYRLAPGTVLFRHQERAAVLVSLGLAVAAGLALTRVVDGRPPAARGPARLALVVAGLTGMLAVLGVVRPAGTLAPFADPLASAALVSGLVAGLLALRAAERLRGSSVGWALVALSVLELFSVNRGPLLGPRAAVAVPPDADPILAALAPRAREGRVSSEGRLPGGPNAASLYGLYDVTGDSPLQLARSDRLLDVAPELVWWRLLGVRFVVTDRPFAPDAPVRPMVERDDATLYEVQLPAEPAWVPQGVAPLPAGWQPDATFDPRALALLPRTLARDVAADRGGMDDGAGRPTGQDGGGTAAAQVEGMARLVGLEPGAATVEATLSATGVLVRSAVYDPGWRARASAEDGRVLRPHVVPVYGALTGVVLPAGEWSVEWTYRPLAAIVGLAISGLTVLLGGWLWRLRPS